MEFSALNRMLFHVVPQIEAGAIHNNNAPLNFHYTSLDSPFILMNNDNDTGWFTGTASAKTIVYKFDNNDVIELSNTGVAIPVWDLDIDSGDLVMGAGDIDLAAAGTQLVAARSSGGGSGAPIWMSMSGTWNGRMVELNNTNAANNQFNLFVTTNGGGAAGYFYNSGSGASARGIYARAANAAVPALYAVNNAAGVAADIEGDVDHLGDYDLDGDLTVLTGGNLNITNGNVIAAGSQFSWTGSTRFKGDAQFWNSAATSNRINWVASTESFGTGLGGYYAAGNRTLWTFTGEAASTDASDLFLDVDANRRIVMGTNVVASGSAVITWPVIKAGLALEAVDNGTDPATPAAGVGRFYTKTDEPWYIDDGGNAKKLTALPTNHLHGFGISVSVASPLTEVVLDVGEARSSDDSSDMTTATTIALDLTTNGVNALDTGSEASSTWYYVWVIHNPTTKVTQGLISASSTSPTLPSGYTKSLRVGTFRNDASSNIIPFKQGGHSHSRTYIYLSSFSSRNVLTTGAATSTTQVDVSSFVPPVSFSADLTITNLSGTRTIFYQTTNGGTIIMEIIEGSTSYSNAPLDTDQSFWYYNDGAAGDANAWVRGWRESL
jgi:hypothetical protein